MLLGNLIGAIENDCEWNRNPYFLNLSKQTFEFQDFLETQIQFLQAVMHFNRPMTVLAARLDNELHRSLVLHNVWEEHGEGDLRSSHRQTFLLLLERLGGLSQTEVFQKPVWPEMRLFNSALDGVAANQSIEFGLACFGIIERLFAPISGEIGFQICRHQWLTEDKMIHYALHQELDVQHSEDFFSCIQEAWISSEQHRTNIESGLRFGATLFMQLYSDLWNHRKRRWQMNWEMNGSIQRATAPMNR